jgi:hypothetical protein
MVGRNNSVSGGAGFNRESVQSLWREALVLRELARDGVSDARVRRSDAKVVRRAAKQEALKTTEEYCADLRAQAEDNLNTAQESLASAERLKGDIEADLEQYGNDVKAKYDRDRKTREDAEAYASSVRAESEERASIIVSDADDKASELQAETESESARIVSESQVSATQMGDESQSRMNEIIAQSHVDAAQIRDEMQAKTAGEIQSLMADVEVARAAIEEEMEAQRPLTEATRIRATSPGIVAKAAAVESDPVELEVVKLAKAEAKKPARRKATARKAKNAA